MSNATPDTFPLICPQCHQHCGLPFSATTLTETLFSIRVSLRCKECKHEWCMDQPSRDLSAPREGYRDARPPRR
jgi:hypothetical protein